jgi:predicted ester cyclase
MSSTNKELVLRLIEQGFNDRNSAVLNDLYAPDCSGGCTDGPLRGREEFVAFSEKYWGFFSDCRMHANFLVSERDIVAVYYTFEGTSTRSLDGYPPTDRRFHIPGALFCRMRDSLIFEFYLIWDNLGPRRQTWLANIVEKQFHKLPLVPD